MGITAPAGPGESAGLVVDFVNTYEPQVDREAWRTADDLGRWLADRRLLPADSVLSEADRATAVTVREGLRAILAGHAGHRDDDEALHALDLALAGMVVRVTLDDTGLRLCGASGPSGPSAGSGPPLNEALALLLDAVRDCTQSGAWPRLKVCARDSCRWAFYDSSRNQVRRWCSMAGCGNHIKMKRAYTARKVREGSNSGSPG